MYNLTPCLLSILPSHETAFLEARFGQRQPSGSPDLALPNTFMNQGIQPRVDNGIGILPIRGALAQFDTTFESYTGELTPYSAIEVAARDFQNNPEVKSVVMLITSPGGEVAGMAGAHKALTDLAATKPLYAVSEGMMASAAYGLATAAHAVYSSSASDIVGNIGSKMVLVDNTKLLDALGLQKFVFTSGPLKSMDPNTPEGAQHLQAIVDAAGQDIYDMVFSSPTVVANNLSEEQKARIKSGAAFSAKEGQNLGLITSILSPQELLMNEQERIAAAAKQQGELQAAQSTITTLQAEVASLTAKLAEQQKLTAEMQKLAIKAEAGPIYKQAYGRDIADADVEMLANLAPAMRAEFLQAASKLKPTAAAPAPAPESKPVLPPEVLAKLGAETATTGANPQPATKSLLQTVAESMYPVRR